MNLIQSINYIQENKKHAEANGLANKVGNIYIACLMIANDVPLTENNITEAKRIVQKQKEMNRKAFNEYLNSVGR